MRNPVPLRPALALVFLVACFTACLVLVGCVVKDEMKDGLREMRSEVQEAVLTVQPDGSGELSFKFVYGIALVDDQGIEPFPWSYRLVDADRHVLAEMTQEMRKAEPEKTKVLVTGERPRKLEVPPGWLVAGRTYALWIVVRYRDETLHEIIWPVTAQSA